MSLHMRICCRMVVSDSDMKAEKIQKEHLYTFLQTLQHQRAVDLLPELTRGLLGGLLIGMHGTVCWN